MKLIIILSFLCAAITSMAQGVSLTIFNNGGQQFFVIMNGIRQNSLPETNVKIGGMTTGSYEVKLIFADGKTADVNKKIWIESPGDYLARVKQKGKKRKLQFFGMVEAGGSQPSNGTSINYRPDDETIYSDQPVSNQPVNPGKEINGSGQVTMPVGTPAANSGVNPSTGQPDANIQLQGNGNATIPPSIETQPTTYGAPVTIPDPNIPTGFGIHINADGTTPTGVSSTSTTTTTSANGQTTTTTTTIQQNGQAVSISTPTATGAVMKGKYTQPATITNEAGTPICTEMLVNIDGFMTELTSATFENDKRSMIEYSLANACLTSDHAYRIVNSLTFEADRMTLSKFLYPHLTDKANASRLIELLTFDNSKKELRAFFNAH